MQAQGWFYSINLTFIFSLLAMAAGNFLCEVAVMYACGEAAGVCIPAQVQAVLKSEHQKMFRFRIGENVTQHRGLFNGGVKGFELSSLCII